MAKLSERQQRDKYAAIAQSVERILGKDEVASSNLASSSKTSEIFGFQRFSFAIIENRQSKVQIRQFCEKRETLNHMYLAGINCGAPDGAPTIV